jgi:hypothetical protein
VKRVPTVAGVPAFRPDDRPSDSTPWRLSGGADLAHSDEERRQNFRLLTDPELATSFRHAHRKLAASDYDTMIRVLGLVWDCPDDAAVNVTGYLCAGCFASRAMLILADRCRDGI